MRRKTNHGRGGLSLRAQSRNLVSNAVSRAPPQARRGVAAPHLASVVMDWVIDGETEDLHFPAPSSLAVRHLWTNKARIE